MCGWSWKRPAAGGDVGRVDDQNAAVLILRMGDAESAVGAAPSIKCHRPIDTIRKCWRQNSIALQQDVNVVTRFGILCSLEHRDTGNLSGQILREMAGLVDGVHHHRLPCTDPRANALERNNDVGCLHVFSVPPARGAEVFPDSRWHPSQ